MARSTPRAPTCKTRKRIRAVPYAHHPAQTGRSLGQSMRRRDSHPSLSLYKPDPDPSHGAFVLSNLEDYSSLLPFFDPDVISVTHGYDCQVPIQPDLNLISHQTLMKQSYQNLQDFYTASPGDGPAHQPLSSIPFTGTWTTSITGPNVFSDSLAGMNWDLNQSNVPHHYHPQPSPVDETANNVHESLLQQNFDGAVSLPPHPSGLVGFGPPFFPSSPPEVPVAGPVFAPYSTQGIGLNAGLGTMDGHWVIPSPGSGSGFEEFPLDDDLMQPAQVLSESDSDDGIMVPTPDQFDGFYPIQPGPSYSQSPEQLPAGKKHTRSRLTTEKRLQAAATRRLGACIRCSIQKVACKPNELDPQGGCCVTCANVSKQSKKVIHRLPCLRWKLTDVTMFRADGLSLTRRWSGTTLRDLGPNDWVDGQVRHLIWQLDHTPFPIQFAVKRFYPQDGDSVTRKWQDSYGRNRETRVEPFGLVDIHKAADAYMFYNADQALRSLHHVTCNMDGSFDPIVQTTYAEVVKLIARGDVSRRDSSGESDDDDKKVPVDQTDFLNKYIRLWFAIRNSTGSGFITPGCDTLDMLPETDPDYPYGMRVSIPRMVSEQFHNIQHEKILSPYRKKVLDDLAKMMFGKNPDHFFTVYLTVFMLLYEASFASRDRHRRAVQCNESTYYSLPGFVEKLQFGANIVLLHWHYYKRGFNPLTLDWNNVKKKAIWSTLTLQQRSFLCDSWQYFTNRAARPMEKMTWRDELYFVKQMFEDDLALGEIYNGI